MKVSSEFSLADSAERGGVGKGGEKKASGSRGYYVRVPLVASLSTPRESRRRKRGIFVSRHPGHVRGAN